MNKADILGLIELNKNTPQFDLPNTGSRQISIHNYGTAYTVAEGKVPQYTNRYFSDPYDTCIAALLSAESPSPQPALRSIAKTKDGQRFTIDNLKSDGIIFVETAPSTWVQQLGEKSGYSVQTWPSVELAFAEYVNNL